MTRFVFNRRTVEDRLVYVDAATLTEARRLAHANQSDATSDGEIVKVTYRLVGEEPRK